MFGQGPPRASVVEQPAQVVLVAGDGKGTRRQGSGGRRQLAEHPGGERRQVLGIENRLRSARLAVSGARTVRHVAVGAQQAPRRLQQPARREPLGRAAKVAPGEQQRALAGRGGQGRQEVAVLVGKARRRWLQHAGGSGPLGLGEQRVLDRLAGEDPFGQPQNPYAAQIRTQRDVHRAHQQPVSDTPPTHPRSGQFRLQGTAEPSQVGTGIHAVQTAQTFEGGFDLLGRGALVRRPVVLPPGGPTYQIPDRLPRPSRQSAPQAQVRRCCDASRNIGHEPVQALRQGDVALDLHLPPVAVLAEAGDLQPAVRTVGPKTAAPLLGVVQYPGAAADPLPGRHRNRPPRPASSRGRGVARTERPRAVGIGAGSGIERLRRAHPAINGRADVQRGANRRRGQPGHDVVAAEPACRQAQQPQQEPSQGALSERSHRRAAERHLRSQQLVVQQAGVRIVAAVQHCHPVKGNAAAHTVDDTAQRGPHLLVRVGHGDDAARCRSGHPRRLPGLRSGEAAHDSAHLGVGIRRTANPRDHDEPFGGRQCTEQAERRGPQPLWQVQQHRPRPGQTCRAVPVRRVLLDERFGGSRRRLGSGRTPAPSPQWHRPGSRPVPRPNRSVVQRGRAGIRP